MRTANILIPVCASVWLVGCPSPGPVKEERRGDPLRLTLSQVSWALEIRAPGFTIQKQEARPDGKGVMLQAMNVDTGIVLSAFLETAPQKGGPKECRDYYWAKMQKAPLERKDVRMSEREEMALLEYAILIGGDKVRQKNVRAYLSRDDVWIDIHVSKTPLLTAEEERMLFELLESIRFSKK